MRQAIITRYLGPTNYRGSRVVARCDAGSVTVSWDHALDIADNHTRAAAMLASKLGWLAHPAGKAFERQAVEDFRATWIGGGMPQAGTRWAYCFVQKER